MTITTFVFPDSSPRASHDAPGAESVPIPQNSSAYPIPYTPNFLASISQDSSLAFTVPFDEVSAFLQAVQEIPDTSAYQDEVEQKRWIMRAARNPNSGSRAALRLWFSDAWNSFVDLIKVRISQLSSFVGQFAYLFFF